MSVIRRYAQLPTRNEVIKNTREDISEIFYHGKSHNNIKRKNRKTKLSRIYLYICLDVLYLSERCSERKCWRAFFELAYLLMHAF